MALKVMLSSVNRGLADVRVAVAPVLKILGFEVIQFETVITAGTVPSRATCVAMVEDCDIYLLILGEEYGNPMPGTHLAPTEEEWRVARSLGKPTVVFKKAGITPGPEQTAFIKRVEDYETGVWRHSFNDAGDLIAQLQGALAAAAETLRPAVPMALASPVAVPWLETQHGVYTGAGTVLETHVVSVGPSPLLPASSFGDLRRTMARAGQDAGLFELGQAIDFSTSETVVTALAKPDGGRPDAGLRVHRNRAVSVSQSLPTSPMVGAVLDEAQFAQRAARDLRLAAGLSVTESERVAIAVGFNDVQMLGIANPTGGMSLPFAIGGGGPVRLEPTDTWPTVALAGGADGIAQEIVARLMLRLNSRR